MELSCRMVLLLLMVRLMTIELRRIYKPDLTIRDQRRHSWNTRGRNRNMSSVNFFPESISKLGHDVSTGTVNALFDF